MSRAPRLTEADVLAVLPADRTVTVLELAHDLRRREPTVRGVLSRLAREGLAEQVPVPGPRGTVRRLEYRRLPDA